MNSEVLARNTVQKDSKENYYRKCLYYMMQGDEDNLITQLVKHWYDTNEIGRQCIHFSYGERITPNFSSYDDWKLASPEDYYSETECTYPIDEEELLDYLTRDYDEDVSEYCTEAVADLSSTEFKQIVDNLQKDADMVCNRIYSIWMKDQVTYLEANYDPER